MADFFKWILRDFFRFAKMRRRIKGESRRSDKLDSVTIRAANRLATIYLWIRFTAHLKREWLKI